jgi:hypothetical protein
VVTLWDLLLLLAPAAALGGAFAGARSGGGGAIGWAASVAAGALVAYATFRLNRLARSYGGRLLAEPDRAATEGRFRILYGLAVGWVFCGGLLGFGITRVLLLIVAA